MCEFQELMDMVEQDIIFRETLRGSLWERFNYDIDSKEMDPDELITK